MYLEASEPGLFLDVEMKIRKKNKILFNRHSRSLQALLALIRAQNHRVLVMWALDCAGETLIEVEGLVPGEDRPRQCLERCTAWAQGAVKMKVAKGAILDCHRATEGLDAIATALCRAIGHAGATVHVETHAIGLPMYELTALVLDLEKRDYERAVTEKIHYYEERLKFWSLETDRQQRNWASFLLEERPNKEKLLWEIEKQMEQKVDKISTGR